MVRLIHLKQQEYIYTDHENEKGLVTLKIMERIKEYIKRYKICERKYMNRKASKE